MEKLPLVSSAPLRYPRVPHGLRGQLMLMAAMLLSAACITLGWFLVSQQIDSITSGLYRSGSLLGENLAVNSRYGVVTGDRDELVRLARGILAVQDVSYVSIFTPDGRPLVALGKGLWERLLATPQSTVLPVNPVLPSLRLESSVTGEVRIVNGRPMFSSRSGFTLTSILTLLVGRDVALYYDIGIPIRQSESSTAQDASLRLLFEQYDAPVLSTPTTPRPLLGIVEVGMSSLSMQEQLRKLMWEAIGITVLILVLSFLLLGFFSHHITTSLRRLTDAASRVAAGNVQIDLRSTTSDEIGDLTRVFSHMLHSIHERETTLHNLNHTLETAIAARTEELRRVNSKLRELDRRKSFFVSTASHEIKTPLTSITCRLENLLMGVDGPLTTEQAKTLERVQVNIGRLQHLLVELLDLSKIELGETTVDLRAVNTALVVAQAIDGLQSLAARKQLRFEVQFPSTLSSVEADAEKLHQIVTNLLHNAVKFSPDHGIIRITGQPTDDGFVRIAVQDSGCGIAHGETERIFEPFYRSEHVSLKTRGTGLGLPIAKHLVELHRGRLWAESVAGQGACFFFTLVKWTGANPCLVDHEEPVLMSRHTSPYGNPRLPGPPVRKAP
ncbi:MAG: HAMP domain-containing histidine kinase [Nitrospira sp.]|nr:HAMP domain-containing histidine kinase [Nitrospira sp. BO4]